MTHDPLYYFIAETASTDDPSLHRVLIVGGGAAGLRLTSLLGATLGRKRKASITLLDKSRIHVWKPHCTKWRRARWTARRICWS